MHAANTNGVKPPHLRGPLALFTTTVDGTTTPCTVTLPPSPVVADDPGQSLQCANVSSQPNVHLLYLVPAVSRAVSHITRSNQVDSWGEGEGRGRQREGRGKGNKERRK